MLVPGRHTLFWQVKPEQHSLESWQLRPLPWHAHMPLWQSMYPQHWRSLVHPWPACTQQRCVEMIWRHCDGAQQSAPPMHTSPARVQSLHTPPLQLAPEQQSESAVQV